MGLSFVPCPLLITPLLVFIVLQLGDQAPDFSLPTGSGDTFRLAQQLGKPVVLYFYPKDDTPGCTAEACAFRDQYEDFLDLDAVVVGVSSDSEASHQRFAQKHRLPFPLLADTSGQLRKKYEVPRALLGLLPGRVTFVIDAAGKIAYIFNSLSGATDHVSKTKEVLRGLAR
jgi:peroxiredoxin Q/BCP